MPVSYSPADELGESRSKLQEIERRLQKTSENLEEKKQAERQLLTDLRSVRNELKRIRERDKNLERELGEIEGRISAKKEEAGEARAHVGEMESQVNARLVALYKSGNAGPMKVLFSSTTPSEMERQFRYVSRIVRHDRELLKEYRARLDSLDQALAALERLRESREMLHAEVQDNRQQLESADDLKQKLLARLRQDKDALAARLDELRDRKARLEKLVKKLESASPREYSGESGSFSSAKGMLPWPAKGRILVGFGTSKHPELGTRHSSNGIEIEAGDNQPIHAVAPGQVVFADAFKGYGNLVIVDHGESFHSLYGNVLRLNTKVGDQLEAGDILAYSGHSGSSGLYFEIRHHGAPLDPMIWLGSPTSQAARRNE
ncbi:MAG: peptidoglycan DD-metalloendopeptidase family protein [Desulfuromonadales bacterium]